MKTLIRASAAATAIIAGLSFSLADEGRDTDVKTDGSVVVRMETSEGVIVMELFPQKAPETVQNFLRYVKNGNYEGTVFHRVIDGFMVQCGGHDVALKETQTLPPINNESSNGLKNNRYTIAMARVGSDPHSATSQFFVNLNDNPFLNRDESEDGFGYAVFGRVIDGKQVVDKIGKATTKTQPNPAFPPQIMQSVPVTPIVIKSVNVISPEI